MNNVSELLDQLIDILNVEETSDAEKIDQIYDLLQKYAAEDTDVEAEAAEAEDMTDAEVLEAVKG